MVKNFWIAFLLIVLNFEISIEEEEPCSGIVSSTQECQDKLTEDDLEYGYKCCYHSSKGNNALSECRLLFPEDYKNIKSVIGELKDQGYEDPSVDCKSNYLQITLLTLLLFAL